MNRAALILLAISLAVSAIFAETLVRLAGFAPRESQVNRYFVPNTDTTWATPDPELGWINREGVSRSIEAGHALMTFWSQGRRAARAEERPDPARPIRVMVIGGSYAQSYGVADEDSFVYRLGERFADVSFENFGTGGYSNVQALMMARRALAGFYANAKPDLILLGFNDAHIMRNVSDQSWIYKISDPEGRYVSPPHYRLRDDELEFYPFKTIGFWPLEHQSAALTVLHNTWLQSIAYNTAAQGPEVTRRVLHMMADWAESEGIALAAVTLEDRSSQAKQILAEMPFPSVDCSGFERTDPETYLLGGGGHPNAKYHAHYADCITPWLASMLSTDHVGGQ